VTEWQGLQVPELDGFTGFVPPEGDGTYGVALVGEAPGENEAKYNKPFYEQAPAGAVLKRLLSRAGLEREKFVISNACWSRPPGNYLDNARYEGEALAAYAPFREKLFEQYRPRVFVALGGVALRTLSQYGGKGTGITSCQGYVLDGPWSGTYVIPALHPSAIMRGEQRMSGCVIWALQRACDIARNGFVRLPTCYITHPSLDDALEFERNYNADTHILSYDIETFESSSLDEEQVEDQDEDISYNITRISLCYDGANGIAISLPWQAPFIDIAKRMLASSGRKRVWNGNFDNPRLSAAGSPVLGRIYDSMWAWKFLQPTLPRSLGFVAPFYNWTGEPWKNTSDSEPEAYSCKDAHALQLIGDGVDAHLRQKGQWHIYERHVVQLTPVLEQMSRNGLPYDQAKADAFSLELKQKWDDRFNELQVRVPDVLKPSKQKTGYKKEPKDTTGLVQRMFNDLDEQMNVVQVTRWCKLEPFLPTSTQQVQALLKFHKLPVGKNRKTKADAADDEHLRKICKQLRNKPKLADVLSTFQMIRECRQLSKDQGNYVKGWKPGRDGRVHATPGYWGKMFRVSWRRPNISATIQDKQEEYIAQGFRKCVAVSTERVLLECDWKGIEAVLVGWFAQDPDYMRLARLGVHDYMGIYMAGQTVDLAASDYDLKALFSAFKRAHPKLRDDAKHTVHGTNYGMGPRLMADMYEMSEKEAKRLQGLYFDLFPKIKTWQKSVCDRASRECKLTNPFNYSMPFWEVYRWDSKYQRYALGEDAKSAIAFLPRDTAAAMLKEVLLRLSYLAAEGVMIASTHDSITCEVDESELPRIAHIVRREMERPVPELNGLSIDVECKAGSSWHDDSMHSLELAQGRAECVVAQ
jgi:uracil-DNA glycosylase family 4